MKEGIIPIKSSNLTPNLQAVVHLLAIHHSLEAIFEDPDHQIAWLNTFHPELKHVPEEMMGESVKGLILIREYIDYVQGKGA